MGAGLDKILAKHRGGAPPTVVAGLDKILAKHRRGAPANSGGPGDTTISHNGAA